MSSTALLLINHGGLFQRLPHFVYSGGRKSKFQCDPDNLSVDNIKEMVLGLGIQRVGLNASTIASLNSL